MIEKNHKQAIKLTKVYTISINLKIMSHKRQEMVQGQQDTMHLHRTAFKLVDL